MGVLLEVYAMLYRSCVADLLETSLRSKLKTSYLLVRSECCISDMFYTRIHILLSTWIQFLALVLVPHYMSVPRTREPAAEFEL